MGFIEELKRRNVVRVGIGYSIVAWLLLQVADVVLQNINAPDWVMQSFMLALVFGFFLALFFAWAFELTPEGVKREKDVDRSKSITPHTGRKLDRAIIVVLVIALGYFIYNELTEDSQPVPIAVEPEQAQQETDRKSIAVLPFANRSDLPQDQFFSDGIHDDLLTSLAKVGSLKVISRTSMMRYRDTELSIPEIARELGVGTVLEGGIQRSADQVRINVQLIDAETDEHLWAENYDRQLSAENLFAIQSEISREIVTALQAQLSEAEDQRLNRAPTNNLEAYGEYVLGRQANARRTVESLNQARAHFEKAIELDPDYAMAYVGLADAMSLTATYGDVIPAELDAPRQAAIDKALELDPDSGEAYTSLAALRMDQPGGEAEAEKYYLKAIELNPSYATAYHWYSFLLTRIGRYEESLPLIREAMELDPLAPILASQYGRVLWALGRVEEANAALMEGIRRNPQFPNHYLNLARNLRELGQLGESMRWVHANMQLDETSAFTHIMYCKRWLDFDDDAEADRCFGAAEESYPVASIAARLELYEYRFQFAESLEEALKLYERFPNPFARLAVGWGRINNGQFEEAFGFISSHWPSILESESLAFADSDDLAAAVIAGYALWSMGEKEQANEILDRCLAHMKTIHRTRGDGYAEQDLIIHVLRGDKPRALAALRDAIDSGWRDNWWRLRYPHYDTMLEEPQWLDMLAELEDDVRQQRQWFEDHKNDPLF